MLLAALFLTAAAPGWAAAASWQGQWSIVDHGLSGAAAGNDYPWSVKLLQSGSTLESTGTPTPYTVQGTASGRKATFVASGFGGYRATFHATLAKNGRTFEADWDDTQGNAGKAVGTRTGSVATPKVAID
jgi:hypothetical protein